MYQIQLGKQTFRYWVGAHSVGIITPNRKKVIVPLPEISSDPSLRVQNGSADARISPDEIAAYIMEPQRKLKFFAK